MSGFADQLGIGGDAKITKLPNGFLVKCRVCWEHGKPNKKPTRPKATLGTIPEVRDWWADHEASPLHQKASR